MIKVTAAKANEDGTMMLEITNGYKTCFMPRVVIKLETIEEKWGTLRNYGRCVRGTFECCEPEIIIEDRSPIELTLEQISKKYGRPVKIVDKK